MADVVGWDVAEKVAARVAGRDPFQDSYLYDSLQPDFDELTAEAEALVADATGLRSAAGPARARVVDRQAWVRANVSSFRRLLRPVIERAAVSLGDSPLAPISRAATGGQVGALLGVASTRVLGQYDILVLDDEAPEDQDLVYYVGPNVLALEKRFSFPPREFRLWLALHEVTHRAQFTGVPWMRGHYLGLVERLLDVVDPDPRRLLDALKRVAGAAAKGRNPLDDGGLVALLATDAQLANIKQVQGLMSLLEGHGDVTMDRAGADRIPSAERFSAVLRQRRQAVNPLLKIVLQLIGIEAKMRQYEAGERFVRHVEQAGGRALLDRAWEDPAHLPDGEEIDHPEYWVLRMRDVERVAG